MPTSQWFLEEDASRYLGVSQKTLQHWREIGYLKPGSHWRSAPSINYLPWNPKVLYHISCCKEIIESWRERESPASELAA